MNEAIALTKKMDEFFYARDMESLKAMYHPDVESFKPGGGSFKGVEANFAGFANLVKMFPEMVYTASNFRAAESISGEDDVVSETTDTCSCTFDTVTECNNPGPQPPANSVYKIVKTNTFKDGLLVRVEMGATEACVICKDNDQ
mmetsp:Transcript_26122/g.32223  ORF Transcript_26122/g.32223 Transcript_26122/m.32223 type:complete len:144 (-) Transcript_26122:7-438(-)